jgi:hypothetical protein
MPELGGGKRAQFLHSFMPCKRLILVMIGGFSMPVLAFFMAGF